jgi:acyl-CoA reductase-like NAD-dependent aldehyde dehydrogenase
LLNRTDISAAFADKGEGAVLPIDKAEMFAYTRRESVGVVAAIVRWNSPLLLLIWKLAPLLAVGGTVIIRPSEHASASTLAFELFSEAGFPPGVVNTSISRNRRARGASFAAANLMRLVSYLGGASNRQSSTRVRNSMRIAPEEVFGPILLVIPFDDEDEGFAIANDSPYGLAAGLWGPI